MFQRVVLFAALAMLASPSAADAFFFRHWCYAPPPYTVSYAPPILILPPVVFAPMYPCPPAHLSPTVQPPKMSEQPSPRPMEKPPTEKSSTQRDEPKSKSVVPAINSVPMKDQPKIEPAIPMIAVPDAPKPLEPKTQPKSGSSDSIPVPLTLPPEKKKDETPEAGLTPIPKLNPPLAVPETAVPKIDLPAPKKDEPKLPEIQLPPITSESKYTPREQFNVRVIPLEGQATAKNRTVSFYNYTDRELPLIVNGQSKSLPAKSSLALALPDSFAWSIGGKAELSDIPQGAAGLSIVIQK